MFGSKKDKSNSIQDETLKDHSKKIVIGVSVLVFAIVLILILEIYTVSLKGSQAKKINIGKSAEQKSKSIIVIRIRSNHCTHTKYEYISSLIVYVILSVVK